MIPNDKVNIVSISALILLMVVEFMLFRSYIIREIVQFYPRAYDQTWYLTQSYSVYTNILQNGITNGIKSFETMPQTFLFHVQGALFFILFGASRATALSINFLYYAIVQVICFGLIKRLTRSYSFSFIFIGLLLSTQSYNWANDFRTDVVAYCLYGVFCASVLYSNIFQKKLWTCIAVATCALLINLRFITSIYIVGDITVLLFFYLFVRLLSKNKEAIENSIIRIRNIVIGSLFTGLIFLPILWQARNKLYNYYFVGHIVGNEKAMRLADALNGTGTTELLYYPYAFFHTHYPANLLFATILIISLFCFIILYSIIYRKVATSTSEIQANFHLCNYKDSSIFLITAVLVPFIILTLDKSKSLLVISIVVVPFILSVTMILSFLYFHANRFSPRIAKLLLTASAIFFFSMGLLNYIKQSLRIEGEHLYNNDKFFTVTNMVDDIGNYANTLHWKLIKCATNKPNDYITAPLAPFYFERHGILFDVQSSKLGASIVDPISRAEAFFELRNTDIYFDNITEFTPDQIYPFEKSVYPFRKKLTQFAEINMIRLNDYLIDNFLYRVYVRPDINMSGFDENIPSVNGIWLTVPNEVAKSIKTIQLEGKIRVASSTQLEMRAVANFIGKMPIQKLNSSFKINGDHYIIKLDLPVYDYSHDTLKINLVFQNSLKNNDKMYIFKPEKKLFIRNKSN